MTNASGKDYIFMHLLKIPSLLMAGLLVKLTPSF